MHYDNLEHCSLSTQQHLFSIWNPFLDFEIEAKVFYVIPHIPIMLLISHISYTKIQFLAFLFDKSIYLFGFFRIPILLSIYFL